MDNSNKIVPPHLNAEVYRTDTTGTSTVSYLDYICLHTDGSVLIGCSELTGRYWNGGVSIFKNKADALSIQTEAKRSISLTSGTADGCFLGISGKVLLCEDSGALSIWSSDCELSNVWQIWSQDLSVAEHDDSVLAVDCLDVDKEYVSVGADGNAKVWDIGEMICVRNYRKAHSSAIYGVSVRPKSKTSFATASMDQYLSLWDENTDKPVLEVMKNDCSIRCLSWLDENRLLYGDEAGMLRLVDVRNHESTMKVAEFPAAVHKLAVHPVRQKVAVCCDNKIVSVCDMSEEGNSKIMYHDRHMHSNCVRGAAWDGRDDSLLHTLGWDGQLKTHVLEWD